MNLQDTEGTRALTSVDVLVVVATLMLGIFVLLPFLAGRGGRSVRISCVSHLRQLGIAARIWSNDHNEHFPWQVPVASTGSFEIATSGNIAAILLPMSNELVTPKLLTCPADRSRKEVADFARLSTRNISYFLGLDSSETNPQSVLYGDRNVSGGQLLSNRVMIVSSSSNIAFGSDLHNLAGNIGLGDGSAMQVSQVSLQKQINWQEQSSTNQIFRWALP